MDEERKSYTIPEDLRLELQAIDAGRDAVTVGWWALVEYVRGEAGDEVADQVESLLSDLRDWEKALLLEFRSVNREVVQEANRQGCDYPEPL